MLVFQTVFGPADIMDSEGSYATLSCGRSQGLSRLKPRDFRIGQEFRCGESIFRCTDVGTRTVTAIRLDHVSKQTWKDGEVTEVPLDRKQAEAEGWFDGPPYAVAEIVFDEDDLECDFEFC